MSIPCLTVTVADFVVGSYQKIEYGISRDPTRWVLVDCGSGPCTHLVYTVTLRKYPLNGNLLESPSVTPSVPGHGSNPELHTHEDHLKPKALKPQKPKP